MFVPTYICKHSTLICRRVMCEWVDTSFCVCGTLHQKHTHMSVLVLLNLFSGDDLQHCCTLLITTSLLYVQDSFYRMMWQWLDITHYVETKTSVGRSYKISSFISKERRVLCKLFIALANLSCIMTVVILCKCNMFYNRMEWKLYF